MNEPDAGGASFVDRGVAASGVRRRGSRQRLESFRGMSGVGMRGVDFCWNWSAENPNRSADFPRSRTLERVAGAALETVCNKYAAATQSSCMLHERGVLALPVGDYCIARHSGPLNVTPSSPLSRYFVRFYRRRPPSATRALCDERDAIHHAHTTAAPQAGSWHRAPIHHALCQLVLPLCPAHLDCAGREGNILPLRRDQPV